MADEESEIDQIANSEQACVCVCVSRSSDWKFRNIRNTRVVEICDPIGIRGRVNEDRLGQAMGP